MERGGGRGREREKKFIPIDFENEIKSECGKRAALYIVRECERIDS